MPKSPKKKLEDVELEETVAKEVLSEDKENAVKEKKTKNKKKENNKKEVKKAKETTKSEKAKKKVESKKEEDNSKEQKEIENEEQVEETAVIEEPIKAIRIDEIRKAIKSKKKIPTEEMYKINKVIFKNLLMAVAVITYFLFINLGFINIDNDVYIVDLKVFSMCILLLAIVLIENAYKKDNGSIAIFGIEMIVASIISISLIYVNLMLAGSYIAITASISFIFAIYYLVKTIVIYLKMKKAYFVNDMKEIINPED